MDQSDINLGKVPLERALSKLGFASRSQAALLIADGKVSVNGAIVRDKFIKVIPEKDIIEVNGKRVVKAETQLIMLNKPKGYVTTKRDEKGRKTIYDLLPANLQHLHPVGRLDMATTGLLLLTTDTAYSDFLTNPSNGMLRTYIVTVDGRLNEDSCDTLKQGLMDNDELLKAHDITLMKVSGRETHLRIQLTEGKNREIRRMMIALGVEVTRLKRISYGPYELGDLPLGEYVKVAQKVKK